MVWPHRTPEIINRHIRPVYDFWSQQFLFYTIYKIINNLNGKYYVGKHQTKDLTDGYMGSGKLILRAIKKHGQTNFSKEILFVFDSEEEMNAKEKELVIVSEETYNLCPGGEGGFGYINTIITKDQRRLISQKCQSIDSLNRYFENNPRNCSEFKNRKISDSLKITHKKNGSYWTGKNHSEETKRKMSLVDRNGVKNSQYGTCWITNNVENKKIKKDDLSTWLSLGYIKGRVKI